MQKRLPYSLSLLGILLCLSLCIYAQPGEEGQTAVEPASQAMSDSKETMPIPYKRESVSTASALWKVVVIFVILIAAGIIALKLSKKRLAGIGLIPAEKDKHISLLDRQQLHGDHAVYYLDIDGEKFVLTVGPGHGQLTKIS